MRGSIVFQLDIQLLLHWQWENPPLKLDKSPPDVVLIELRMQMHNFIENKTISFVRLLVGGDGNSCGQIVSGGA